MGANESDLYGVNVDCLDDATTDELAQAPISYQDGKHDSWEPHLLRLGICEWWDGFRRVSAGGRLQSR